MICKMYKKVKMMQVGPCNNLVESFYVRNLHHTMRHVQQTPKGLDGYGC